jgi:hypothetical protein
LLYRIIHAVNASYVLAVASLYIGAAALALCLLFIFPQVALLLLFMGLASLGFSVMIGWMIDGATRAIARRALASGRCPCCQAAGQPALQADAVWICRACMTEFEPGGGQIDPRDRARWVESQP